MKILPVSLDDELASALETICAEQGRDETQVLREVVRKFVQKERLKKALQDTALADLYGELSAQDSALAEEGIEDYKRMLDSADQK